jgi:hypothetical protein
MNIIIPATKFERIPKAGAVRKRPAIYLPYDFALELRDQTILNAGSETYVARYGLNQGEFTLVVNGAEYQFPYYDSFGISAIGP